MLIDNNPYEMMYDHKCVIRRLPSLRDAFEYAHADCKNLESISLSKETKTCIFVDDERYIDDVTWVDYPEYWRVHTIRTFDDFKKKVVNVMECTYIPTEAIHIFDFSFDHDLQLFDDTGREITGYDFVKWLCDYLVERKVDLNSLSYVVHSKNPVGAENINAYIENYKGFLNDEKV